MTLVSKRQMGFSTVSLQKRKYPHAFHYLSERVTFWVAVLSLLAFVTGNMVGQHGWHVFWKSVLGESNDSLITFTGTVPPIQEVPNFEAWAALGGDLHVHTFRQVPADLLRPLPAYTSEQVSQAFGNVYFVDHLGTYKTGRGEGAHPGIDIAAPVGTPVHAVANGIVERVGYDAGGYGHFLVIRHPHAPSPGSAKTKVTLHSVYGHLSEVLATEGTVITKGDTVALTGQSGFATGPHLHFQLDQDSAPWHPYWPFSGSEAREAGMNFAQAVDAGLHRERGLEHTTNPMLYVQAYQSFVAPQAVAIRGEEQGSRRPLSRKERMDARVAARKKAVAEREAVLAVQTPSPAIAVSSSSALSATSTPTVVGTATLAVTDAEDVAPAVTSAAIRHDGSFARAIEEITISLLNADGIKIAAPRLGKPLYMRTAYGRAEFDPPVLTEEMFKNGKGTVSVRMRPIGETTIIIQLQPLGYEGKPMPYER